MKRFMPVLAAFILVVAMSAKSMAASQGKLHVAVYSGGFVVDTERQVAYGDRMKRVAVKTLGKGTASGELPTSHIEIHRLDQGKSYLIDPLTKTYRIQEFRSSGIPEMTVAGSKGEPATMIASRIEPKVTGPLGSSKINGVMSESYTIRLEVDFADVATGKVLATETLLEKLWVSTRSAAVQQFRMDETEFFETLSAANGTETADFRWLLREFNRHILEMAGNQDDFEKIRTAYRTARAQVGGATVRQLAAWAWRPKDESAPASASAEEMTEFIGAIAAGLGAPPDAEGKKPLSESMRPYWVTEMEKDLGRTGPTAMMLNEVLQAKTAAPTTGVFDVPETYKLAK